jgi:5-methylcytosine-specific restriction endonuclease McrA
MQYQIKLKRNGGISREELLADLKKVEEKIKKSPTMDEYEKYGKFTRGPFKKKFTNWNNALKTAGFSIIKHGNNTITKEILLNNLASVWEKIGKQPSQNNLNDKILSKFSASAYKRTFGTYNKALIIFEKWIKSEQQEALKNTIEEKGAGHRTKRDINQRLRALILQRDRYTCQHCGWSPAKNIGDRILEVDHKLPWEKGGETMPDNLQTLCSVCNRGKSNAIIN